MIARLQPLIIEIERQSFPLLIIGHTAVLRVILAYFLGTERAELPHMGMPLHTLTELSRGPYGCEARRYDLNTGLLQASPDADEPDTSRASS